MNNKSDSTKVYLSAESASRSLRGVADKSRVPTLQRFFKTGPGDYAEGDLFVGATAPQVRKLARTFEAMPLIEVKKLLRSPIHEARLLALLIWVRQYQCGDEKSREKIFHGYTTHFKWINNWDLIDVTAPHIVGSHLSKCDPRSALFEWAASDDLWQRRIAIMSTFYFIKQGDFADTLRLAKMLLQDEHDLIHKAVGWMLREVGKRDQATEEAFLKKHYKKMPRTMLRYAIEQFEETRRQDYLKGTV